MFENPYEPCGWQNGTGTGCPLSLPFHQWSVFIFIYMLVLIIRTSGRCLAGFQKGMLFRKPMSIGQQSTFDWCSKSFFGPVPPHDLVDFVVLPPGHGSSVTDFWGWDAHEAQLRCPDDVSGDIGGWSARRALKPKFYQSTQTMVTAGILPFRENSHGRAGDRSRDLMISSQRLWPLDHEAGRV